jgi:hypothetical protein
VSRIRWIVEWCVVVEDDEDDECTTWGVPNDEVSTVRWTVAPHEADAGGARG